MKQTLNLQNTIGMGFMAFAMFLGAGNLIFPPLIGYQAGENLWYAAAGFLVTGVGLPLLGIVTISRVGGGFNNITQELPEGLVVALGSFIFLIIGPLYAVPRTALVAFEVGLNSVLPKSNEYIQLAFSLVFFAIAWYLSIRPGKLLDSVGKLITPALILLLAIIGISPLIAPQGSPETAFTQYREAPFIHGFLEGYMTMDALAALMFGIVIITNLRSHGIQDPKSLFRYSVVTGVIAAIGLALVYISLFYLGATSRELITAPDNGGQILSIYTRLLFGNAGAALLAAVVVLACLTTAIGCITATSEYFDVLLPRLSYRVVVTIITLTCIAVANMGRLSEIIQLFIPALLILYPVTIALILLGLVRDYLPNPVIIYRTTLTTAFVFSVIDVLSSLDIPALSVFLQPFNALPGFNEHLLWIPPALIMFIISLGWSSVYKSSD